jgi:hypothetical protein
MKIAGIFAGLIVAAATVYFIFVRKPLPAAPSANPFGSGTIGSTDSGSMPKPNQPIESPRTREDETRQEFSRKRLPFYKFLRDNFAEVIQHFAVTESIDTLDVQVAKDDDKILHRILSEAVQDGRPAGHLDRRIRPRRERSVEYIQEVSHETTPHRYHVRYQRNGFICQ